MVCLLQPRNTTIIFDRSIIYSGVSIDRHRRTVLLSNWSSSLHYYFYAAEHAALLGSRFWRFVVSQLAVKFTNLRRYRQKVKPRRPVSSSSVKLAAFDGDHSAPYWIKVAFNYPTLCTHSAILWGGLHVWRWRPFSFRGGNHSSFGSGYL